MLFFFNLCNLSILDANFRRKNLPVFNIYELALYNFDHIFSVNPKA